MKKMICLLACLASALMAGCGPYRSKAKRSANERLQRLEVVTPTRATVERRVELAATVEAYQRVDISARVPGEVAHLPPSIDIGRRITEGDVLLRLAVPEL